MLIPKFKENEFGYATNIRDRLRELYPVNEEIKKSPVEVRRRVQGAISFMRTELARVRENADLERSLQIAVFNYLMELWDGSPADTYGGTAHYPYEPDK